jgi:hypothetical protein
MKFEQAKKLLLVDVESLDIEELQKYNGKLVSLYYILNGTQGQKTLWDGGFIIPMIDVGAKGFVPKDKFMFTNLINKMNEVELKIKNVS